MDWVNAMVKINNKFKFQLFGRTYDNLLHLYTVIPKYDNDRKGGVSEHAFTLLLNASGVFFTTQEIRTIKDNYPHQEGVNYRLFIENVRNDLSQKRLATIDHVFSQFQQNGKAPIAAFLGSLAIEKHPHVRSHNKKKEKAKEDIEAGLKYWSSDSQNLTYQEFDQYCKDVNACIPLERQQFFIDIFVHTFGLFENGVSLDRIKQLEVTIFEKVRQRTEIKKDEGWKSSNTFKFLDLQDKGVMNYQRFVSVLDRVGCKFTDKELKAIFYKHSEGSTILSYQGLCGLFFHMGSGNKNNPNVVFDMASSANGSITTPGMSKKLH